jgi:hypothetical protein
MSDLTEFAGLPVVEFPASGTSQERLERLRDQGGDPHDPASTAWRLRTSAGMHTTSEDSYTDYFARFLAEVDAERLHYHFLSEEMEERVRAAFAGSGVELDLGDAQRDEEEWEAEEDEEPFYYTAASE